MELVDRATVRLFLSVIAPREAPGVLLVAGDAHAAVERTKPIPWDWIEEAIAGGADLRVLPLPASPSGARPDFYSVWIHLPESGTPPEEVAPRLKPAVPAAVCRSGSGITVHWRVHPLGPDEALALMDAAASILDAVPGYPEESLPVPLRPEDLWAARPATVYTPESLTACLEAARRLREPPAPPPPAAPEEPPAQPDTPEERGMPAQEPVPLPDGWIPWEEAASVLASAGQDGLAKALLDTALGSAGDVERALALLGLEAAAEVGGVPMVLKDGRWYRIAVRSVELALAPAGSEDLPDKPEV